MKPTRSLIVSWLLGASVVALVTFSFEALSAREAETATRPVTGAVVLTGTTGSSGCPAMEGTLRCPASGVTASPAAPSDRCPAGADVSRLPRPGLRV
ncbi:MAG: hypothetical protein IPN03_12010 [Holophagales bacterium]|nr:hypothetical protein [Holophagales bacterium]